MRGVKRPHTENGTEEISDQLDLLREPPTHSQVTSGRWTFHNPPDLNPMASDVRIMAPRSDSEFTDLSDARLMIDYQVVQANGAAIGGQDAFTCYPGDFGDLLFESAQLRINNTLVEHVDNYGVTSYIQTLLGSTPAAKSSRLKAEGWYDDDTRGRAQGTADADETVRRTDIQNSITQKLVLRPKFALCQQRRMFPPGTEFEFLFRRAPNNFFLMADGAGNIMRIKITRAVLRVRRYLIDESVYSALFSAATGVGPGTPSTAGYFQYPNKTLETTEHTIAAGVTNHTINIPTLKRPNKVLVVFVRQDAHGGIHDQNPVQFQNLDVSSAELKFDGTPVDQEIECDFRANGSTSRAYSNLFDVAFRSSRHDSHGVTTEEFRNYSTIFAWNTQDLIGSGVDKRQTVSLSASFKMRQPTGNVITALVIRETNRRVHLGADGTVLKDET